MKPLSMVFFVLTVLAAWVVQTGAQQMCPAQCSCSCPIGDFNAYEFKEAVANATPVTVCTNFSCGDIVVKRTIRLLTPTPDTPGGQHYLAYELRSETYDEKQNPGVLTFQTSHNTTTQDTRLQTILLMVPAGKSIPSKGEPPPTLPATSDGFLCFKPSSVRLGIGSVTNTDQLATQTFVIHRVAYTCVSAGINAPPPAADTWLLGVAAKDSTFHFPPEAAIIDIFHPSGEVIDLDPIDELVSVATVTP